MREVELEVDGGVPAIGSDKGGCVTLAHRLDGYRRCRVRGGGEYEKEGEQGQEDLHCVGPSGGAFVQHTKCVRRSRMKQGRSIAPGLALVRDRVKLRWKK